MNRCYVAMLSIVYIRQCLVVICDVLFFSSFNYIERDVCQYIPLSDESYS